MDICRVTLINKGIKYWYNLFLVPGNGAALLGMLDCECLQLLSINCQITNNLQINEQTKQSKSIPNSSIKNNLYTRNKTNQEVDYFIVGPHMEANREVSTKTLKIYEEYGNVFTGIGCFKNASLLQIKDDKKQYQVSLRCVAYSSRTHLKRIRKATRAIKGHF